jgi:8-oxo-(d)GTP phosphatase
MVIFINDIRVTIHQPDEKPGAGLYNHSIDAEHEPITAAKLIHNVWVYNANAQVMEQLLDLLNSNVPLNLLSLFITVKDYSAIKNFLATRFKVIKAAGGIVRKKDKFLMIYRLKKWDLPKGKKERGEKYKETAVREIEEECNVSVKIGGKICTTWHTYTMNKKAMLKKTRWYVLDCLNDSNMMPAAEEDIEEARWMSPKEVYHSLQNSYKSIHYVFEQYYALKGVKAER